MKQPRLLHLKIDGANIFEDNCFEISFNNKQNVHVDKDNENMFNLYSSVYLPRIISIIGINASGKSTSLDLINWALSVYFCNVDINEVGSDIKNVTKIFNDEVNIEIFYSVEDKIYNVFSKIILDFEKRLYFFEDEVIRKREVNSSLKNSNLFELSYYQDFTSRSGLSIEEKTFLEPSKSISKLTIPSNDNSMLINLCYLNENNKLNSPSNYLEPSIIKFLDPSIEYIIPDIRKEEINNRKVSRTLYKVKFINREEIVLNTQELDSILSSGTKKGIALLSRVSQVFNRGGYLLVDEIENHFNKSIVLDIFKLFRSKTLNPKAAMLIFSSHYTELIDSFDRNDMINITTKSKHSSKILLTNLTKILKRSDLKKSDVYFSDYYNIGTSTNYNNYLSMLESFKKMIIEESKKINDSSVD